MAECSCSETYYTDLNGIERRIHHPLHDCAYVKRRNALIPFAMREAKQESRAEPTTEDFIRAMDRLSTESERRR